jgi:hypothetical protein
MGLKPTISSSDLPGVQPGVQQIAETGADAGGNGASASSAENEPVALDALRAGRDVKGHFRAGHRLNIVGGQKSDRLPAGLDYLQVDVDRFISGSLIDEGDQQDIPVRRRAQLEYRARLHRRILQLDAVLDQRGLVDRRGKLRVAWLSQLQSLIAAAVTIDKLLGLERKQKVALDLADYLQQRETTASETTEEPSS